MTVACSVAGDAGFAEEGRRVSEILARTEVGTHPLKPYSAPGGEIHCPGADREHHQG